MPNKKTAMKLRGNILTRASIGITTVLAMLAYSAFPLASFLNRPYFWHGLVSGLSEPGQPHHEFFTAIDITASLFGVMFFGYLSWKQEWDRPQSTALGLVVVACFAELLTDVFALPANFSTTGSIPPLHYFATHPSFDIHLAASFVNSVAFLVSFGLWVLHRRHTKSESIIRESVFVLALVISTIGSAIGHFYPATSPTLQRVFILCYCYWFIAFPYDSLSKKRRARRLQAATR
jgi:hypothetical protein